MATASLAAGLDGHGIGTHLGDDGSGRVEPLETHARPDAPDGAAATGVIANPVTCVPVARSVTARPGHGGARPGARGA